LSQKFQKQSRRLTLLQSFALNSSDFFFFFLLPKHLSQKFQQKSRRLTLLQSFAVFASIFLFFCFQTLVTEIPNTISEAYPSSVICVVCFINMHLGGGNSYSYLFQERISAPYSPCRYLIYPKRSWAFRGLIEFVGHKGLMSAPYSPCRYLIYPKPPQLLQIPQPSKHFNPLHHQHQALMAHELYQAPMAHEPATLRTHARSPRTLSSPYGPRTHNTLIPTLITIKVYVLPPFPPPFPPSPPSPPPFTQTQINPPARPAHTFHHELTNASFPPGIVHVVHVC